MEKYVINGGHELYGDVEICGAKNAAVAIIPAALLVRGVCRLENMPQISDTVIQLKIIEAMGATVRRINKTTVEIDATEVHRSDSPMEFMRQIRASYYYIGAMLGRFGDAKVTMPGGCDFGERPIDQHIKAMRAFGAEIEVRNGFIFADTAEGRLKGSVVTFDIVSVGATINGIIAAATAEGRTILNNAAKEPHIVDVANFLNSMGADIRGAGTDSIRIVGTDKLHGGVYSMIPDQIEAGTYMAAVAAAGGEIVIKNIIPRHLECISLKLREMGVEIIDREDSVLVRRDPTVRLKRTNVKTLPYPGFPTDMQPQVTTLLSLAEGTSIITEGVWDNRYQYVSELRKMGAQIQVDGSLAVVEGVESLTGALVTACDLRAGAAVVIAGLYAVGSTVVEDIHFIERGYEDFAGKLRRLGADIVIVSDPEPTAIKQEIV